MSGAPILRAVELVATSSIQKKGKNPDRLKKGTINTDGAVTGSLLNGRVSRAFVRGESGKRTLLSTRALRVLRLAGLGHSQRFFYQIGCSRESVGHYNRFLDPASIVTVSRVVQHLT
jgi:hypothetical protein